ncbi:MAG TPA: IPT/TIG domain-containing protein [Bryobacteraceae bacterium]|nr:IPT/TIG domain-containing protein [Bryobacteraceae bacterium]
MSDLSTSVRVLVFGVAVSAWAQRPAAIASISVCNPNGTGGQGSCPAGSFDTHQSVLGPGGGSVNASALGVAPAPDEHSTVFAPGTLGGNHDYLFFLASPEGGHAAIGVAVLSGGAGPDKNGQWTLDFPRADGYGSYAGGFGQVFNPSTKGDVCPTVPDGNAAHQDQTFDIHYAASGSIVKDVTAAPGSLLMVYEGTNACIGNAGGPIVSDSDDYISLAIATSVDYGKSWPTYRGTPTFNFVPMPGFNATQGPNAPMGALGKNVCMGNDCTTTPLASYGRYPVVTPTTSLATLIAAGQPLTSKFGEQEISGFVDDVAGGAATYIYANSGNARVARAKLNGGSAPLAFLKWDGQGFNSPGLGGTEVSVLPAGPFGNCEAPAQSQIGSSISYVDDTQQYLLTFLCVSPGDPARGQSAGGTRGAAWFYSTSYDLSDQTQWSAPQEIAGSWSEFDNSGGCPDYKGFYPTFMSPGKSAGHLSLTGNVFYLWGCQTGGTPGGRQFSSRAFTMATAAAGTPAITKVANAEGEIPTIAPNTWVEIKGQNLAPAGDSRIWAAADFANNKMPTQLDGVSATVNGKSAFVYYISPTQINILTPPDAISGPVQVQVANGSATSTNFAVQAQALSPSFFVFNGGPYVAATHADGALLGPASLYPGSTAPAKPGETIVLYANGFGPVSTPVVSGSPMQSGALSPLPVVKIGGTQAEVVFAGLVSPGQFQFNVVVPANTPDGDQAITASYDGQTTQAGTLVTVQR